MPQPAQPPLAADDLPEHVRLNRAVWDGWAAEYAAYGERAWAAAEPSWGLWDVPESALQLLPANLSGMDAIELGCGTAYVSAWMARRGARVVGIDNSAAQLATAWRLQQQHGLVFPLLHGSAEAVPCPDASFDFAISEYGACLWADPAHWVAEAARLLVQGAPSPRDKTQIAGIATTPQACMNPCAGSQQPLRAWQNQPMRRTQPEAVTAASRHLARCCSAVARVAPPRMRCTSASTWAD
jgi:SAM-dependent methyltransferase